MLSYVSDLLFLPDAHLVFLSTGSVPADSIAQISNSYLWFAIAVFTVAFISLVVAYRSRNEAFKLAKVQQDHLQELNQQLREQSDELTQTNASKDQLISVISHDLRAPLASLDSCLEIMLTEDLTTEEKDELIRDLQKETYNTLKTLDDLLAWARLQQQGGKFDEQDFDIVGLIREVTGLYAPVAKHKSVRIIFEPFDDSITVKGDPNQIRTVLRNLVSNAIKFTPENAQVSIALNTCEEGVEISVQDEGKGISKEELTKIMDPDNFYSSKGTAGEGGTGVGLMLSFEFINKHNSELQLMPALPSGTRASFHLPHSKSESSVKSA